jgi:hypothetical protein
VLATLRASPLRRPPARWTVRTHPTGRATSCLANASASAAGSAATVTTSVNALAFTMPFFGATNTVGYYSVTYNGFAQLYASASGTPSTAWSNVSIPSTSTPNGFVAPFWDDLYPGTGTGGGAESVSAFADHFTIQWANVRPSSDSNGHPTFQAKLFASVVVEHHYCSPTTTGTSTSYVTGSSATVGLENADGTDGVQHSCDTAGAGATGAGICYTPN